MRSIVFSHKGQRKVNQDYVLVENINPDTELYLIADGMGGYENGELAAKIASESILTFLSTVKLIDESQVQKAINKANLAIRQYKEQFNVTLGTTVGGVIIHFKQAICFWVGDVKIFHFKKNEIIKESTPHTLMNEVIRNGTIKDPNQIKKYKHVVTRSIQGDIKLSQIDSFKVEKIDCSDLFLICSDGIHDLYDALYFQHLFNNSTSKEEALDKIERQLLIDALDNFSLIMLF
jgi:serine/threonine protein phosphatase PrpC